MALCLGITDQQGSFLHAQRALMIAKQPDGSRNEGCYFKWQACWCQKITLPASMKQSITCPLFAGRGSNSSAHNAAPCHPQRYKAIACQHSFENSVELCQEFCEANIPRWQTLMPSGMEITIPYFMCEGCHEWVSLMGQCGLARNLYMKLPSISSSDCCGMLTNALIMHIAGQ